MGGTQELGVTVELVFHFNASSNESTFSKDTDGFDQLFAQMCCILILKLDHDALRFRRATQISDILEGSPKRFCGCLPEKVFESPPSC